MLIFHCSFSQAQQIANLRAEQDGTRINIYYDLITANNTDKFDVQVFYSTDGEKSWAGPVKYVQGAVGYSQTAGKNKQIIWDVLRETELTGQVVFRIDARISLIEVLFGSNPNQAEVYINGIYRGLTPCRVSLPPGYVNIEMRKDNYQNFSKAVTITEGTTYYTLELSPVRQQVSKPPKTHKYKIPAADYNIKKYAIVSYGPKSYEFGLEMGWDDHAENTTAPGDAGLVSFGAFYRFPINKPYKVQLEEKDDISEGIFDNESGYYKKDFGIYMKFGYKVNAPFLIVPHISIGLDWLRQKKIYTADKDYEYIDFISQHTLKAGESIIVRDDGSLIDNTLDKYMVLLGVGIDIPFARALYFSSDFFLITADRMGFKVGIGLFGF